MPKSSVGLPRALARVRPPRIRRPSSGGRRSAFRPARLAGRALRPVQRSVTSRFGVEAAIPAVVALVLCLASIVSLLPGLPARGAVDGAVAGAVGGPSGLAPLTVIHPPAAMRQLPTPRPAGEDDGPDTGAAADAQADAETRGDGHREANRADPALDAGPAGAAAEGVANGAARDDETPATRPASLDLTRIDPDAVAATRATPEPSEAPLSGPFLADGTLQKPIAVTTTVADGRGLLRTHEIAAGDNLGTIADRYNVSMMTIWWANNLRSHNLTIGKTLTIPPVDGLVVQVGEGESLRTLARKHDVDPQRVLEVNKLEDRVLVAGQTLVLPGAAGAPIPEPTPPPTSPDSKAGAAGGGGTTSRPAKEPAAFDGRGMAWPVIGGNQFVSRGFFPGHYGLDIAADSGARVVAGASGTVTFAGWKPNGGGYQVWIAHGSGIYTTYNHLSAVSVGTGQSVGAGQQVGRVGTSGMSTGPHLHFEVWHGAIWSGGTRVNPMSHL